MIGHQNRDQLEFFVCGSLRDLVPDDHILARVDRVLDLSWLRDEVADLYAPGVGRPGIEPEAAVRLMLAGFPLGVVRDRRLMREAQVNPAIRWFAGYGLNARLPDHSSLTRIRQRWGAERFRRIFERTVRDCVKAGPSGPCFGSISSTGRDRPGGPGPPHKRQGRGGACGRLADPGRRQLGEPG